MGLSLENTLKLVYSCPFLLAKLVSSERNDHSSASENVNLDFIILR